MLKISLCDDDKRMLNQIEEMADKYLVESKIKATISRYASGEEFLEKANIEDIDILFLDIQMEEVDGLGVAEALRKVNNYAELIFITSYDQYMRYVFKYKASGYLSKPVSEDDFNKILDQVTENIFRRGEKFFYKVGHKEENVFKNEITYIESDRNNLIMHLENREEEIFAATLQDVRKQLNGEFAQINRSTLINMNKFKRINLKEVEMNDDTVITISQNLREEVMKIYLKLKEKSRNI